MQYKHLAYSQTWKFTPTIAYHIGECEAIISAIRDMPIEPTRHKRMCEVSMIKGAQATTAIEGNTLSDEEVKRVAEGGEVSPSLAYQATEVRNVLDAMNTLLEEVAIEGKPQMITPALIKRFHQMIGKDLGEHLDAIPGKFRRDNRYVGSYRAPNYENVDTLIERLCEWLPQEFNYNQGETQPFSFAVVQAIVTHVYLEWIHPFGDGNGRTGRLLEFYILLRAGNPDFASHIMSNFYNRTRPQYYRHLDQASKTGDLTAFIGYAIEGYRDGLNDVLQEIQGGVFEISWRSYVYERFKTVSYRKSVFNRRRDLVLNMPLEKTLTINEMMLLTPELMSAYSGLEWRQVQRDVQLLIDLELIVQDGDGYRVNSDQLRRPRRLRQKPGNSGDS